MFHPAYWPFTPERLSAILDPETLAVIQTGSVARMGAALSILDANATAPGAERVDPIDLSSRFAPFCALLRNEERVRGGNRACEQCDADIARKALSQERHLAYKPYTCHIGVLDARHIVTVHGHPVAVLFAGQFRPEGGVEAIQRNVALLGSGRYKEIIPLDESVRRDLHLRAAELQPKPPDFERRLQREAEYISRLAEAQFDSIKTRWEQAFLDRLRSTRPLDQVDDIQQVRALAATLLEQLRSFCRCDYVVFFANVQENETVLIPLAQAGLPAGSTERLPHFNWKKAGLLEDAQRPPRLAQTQATLLRGIRGDGRALIEQARFAAPATLGKLYRSVLIFGPFAEEIDLVKEQHFLAETSRIIGWLLLSELQLLNLQKQRDLSENRVRLLTHQLRTAITPIATHVGAARLLQSKVLTQDQATRMIANYLNIAQEMCISLGRAADMTLNSHVVLLERDDLKLEPYPLSVLVANCAGGFEQRAGERQRRIMVDDNVELLPTAEIDVARFTIAFSNLIENAIKYSYPGTRIVIRAGDRQNRLDLDYAVIEVQDDGDDIPADQVERVFEAGTRLLTGVKMRQIPGSGLGLWEARAVVEAHGGRITVRSVPASFFYRQKRAYRVTFAIRIPLQQNQ